MFFTDGDGNVSGQFTNGNPGAGQQATQVNADWLNMVQDEMGNVLSLAGVTPVKSNNAQLVSAIQRVLPRAKILVTGGAASFSGDHTGVASVTITTSGGISVLQVTLSTGWVTSGNWTPMVSNANIQHPEQVYSVASQSALVLEISGVTSGGTTPINFTSASGEVNLIVVGF